MPQGAQGLGPFTAGPFTAFTDGNLYKGQIDLDRSVLSPAGFGYVYPNSPSGMSILVDDGFNYTQPGTGLVLNSGSSANTISVTAPGSNSKYVVIYFDQVAGTFGAYDGPSSATPVLTLPDNAYQTPLAAILVTSTQTSIGAGDITDIRQMQSYCPLVKNLGTISSNTTVNCYGASEITIAYNIGAAITLTLSNLRSGVHLDIQLGNSSGGSLLHKIAATNPTGGAYSVNAKASGASAGFTSFNSTGITYPNATAWLISGKAVTSSVLTLVNN